MELYVVIFDQVMITPFLSFFYKNLLVLYV